MINKFNSSEIHFHLDLQPTTCRKLLLIRISIKEDEKNKAKIYLIERRRRKEEKQGTRRCNLDLERGIRTGRQALAWIRSRDPFRLFWPAFDLFPRALPRTRHFKSLSICLFSLSARPP